MRLVSFLSAWAMLLATSAFAQTPIERAERTLRHFDHDEDGRLSFEEFGRIPRREASPLIFMRTDSDGDRLLDRDEMAALFDGHLVAHADPAAGVDVGYDMMRDVPYGNSHRLQKLDIYAPQGADALPVVVFVHGGGWAFGDKRGAGAKPEFFTANGMVFVSVNYRLAPESIHPVPVEDVALALAWIHDHIAEHGGDSRRIVVMGHSAGAHLAALVSTDEEPLCKVGKNLSILQGAVLLDGAGYDVQRQVRSAGPMLRQTYVQAFTNDPDAQHDASPVVHAATNKDIPPFLLIHVASRPDAALQANALADALRTAGVPAEVRAAEGKTHETLNRELGTPGDEPTRWVLEFLSSLRPSPDPGS